jgi:hypothetical protein
MEAELKAVVLHLGIEMADCFQIGAMIKIQCMIEERDPRISREDIEAYIRLQQQFMMDLKLYTRIMDAQQATLKAHLAQKAERKAQVVSSGNLMDQTGPGAIPRDSAYVWDTFLEMAAWTPQDLIHREPDRFMTIEDARAVGKIPAEVQDGISQE